MSVYLILPVLIVFFYCLFKTRKNYLVIDSIVNDISIDSNKAAELINDNKGFIIVYNEITDSKYLKRIYSLKLLKNNNVYATSLNDMNFNQKLPLNIDEKSNEVSTPYVIKIESNTILSNEETLDFFSM